MVLGPVCQPAELKSVSKTQGPMRDTVIKDKVADASEWHPRLISGPHTHTHPYTHTCVHILTHAHTCVHIQSCTHAHTHMNTHIKYISERTFSLVPKLLCILLIPRYLTWKPSPVKIRNSYFMINYDSTYFLRATCGYTSLCLPSSFVYCCGRDDSWGCLPRS